MLKTRKIYRAGYEFQVPESNMCSLRFKGGGGGDAPTRPKMDEMGEELQSELFTYLESGLRGAGLNPDMQARSIREMLAATTEEFHQTQSDLPGMLARTIPKADTGVRSFIRENVDASYARTKEGIRDEFAGGEFEDKGIAQNLAFNALATEKGVGSQISDMFNQSQLRRSQAPSFGSELAGGIGGAAGILAGGYRPTTQQAPTYGGASVFNPAGASYLSDAWLGSAAPAVSYSQGFTNLP